MKDGQPKASLKERLHKKTQEAQKRQEDLIASESKCLKTNLQNSLSDVQNTIVDGIQDLKLTTQKSINEANFTFQKEETEALSKLEQAVLQNSQTLSLMRHQISLRNNLAMLTIGLGAGLLVGIGVTNYLTPKSQSVTITQLPQPKPPIAKPTTIMLPGQYMITDLKTGNSLNCNLKQNLKESDCKKVEF